MVIPKNIKGVIFDFDGTLFDLEIDWSTLNAIAKKKFGLVTLDDTQALTQKMLKEFHGFILTREIDGVRNGKPTRGSLEVLEVLSKKYTLAITSRNSRKTIEAGLKKIGYTKPVVIVSREDVVNPKPHPESLLKATEEMGLKPSEVVVVGDTTHDSQAAAALEVPCIIVNNPKLAFQPKDAEYFINSLSELNLNDGAIS